jgi:hypothetical protein
MFAASDVAKVPKASSDSQPDNLKLGKENEMKVPVAVEDEIFVPAIEDTLTKLPWQPGTIFRVMHAIEAGEAVSHWASKVYRNEAVALVASVAARLRKVLDQALVEEA